MTHDKALNKLIREASQLKRRLAKLVSEYGAEDHRYADARIFNRLLTNDWRFSLDVNGPLELRYVRATEWVSKFGNYIDRLRDYCRYNLGSPSHFANLPLNGNQRASAGECLQRLDRLREVLVRWRSDAKRPFSDPHAARNNPSPFLETELRRTLQGLVDTKGATVVANEIPCNRDTLRDFLSGSAKTQERILKRMRKYADANKPL